MTGKTYEKPSIIKIDSIEQLVQKIPRIKEALAERDLEVARAICSLLGHEINNPLTSVIGYSNLLEGGPTEDRKVKNYSSIIAHSAKRAGDILHRFGKIKRVVIGKNGLLDLNWSTKEYSEPMTAIIVEDDASLRAVIGDVLTMKGFKVLDFRDPEEAHINFKSTPSSILVTDINLRTEQTGLDLIRDIYLTTKKRNYLMPAVLVASSSLGNKVPNNGRCYDEVLQELATSYKFFYSPVEKPIKLDNLRQRADLAENYQASMRSLTYLDQLC